MNDVTYAIILCGASAILFPILCVALVLIARPLSDLWERFTRWLKQFSLVRPQPAKPCFTLEEWLAMDDATRNAALGYELQLHRERLDRIAQSADAATWMAFWAALED